MDNNERAMYTGMAMSRNTEITLRWSRSQFFLIIHLALLSLLAGIFQQRGIILPFVQVIVGLAGSITGILWFLTNVRTNHWVRYWESRLTIVERAEPEPVRHGIYSGPEFERLRQYAITIRVILTVLIGFVTLGWIVVQVHAFFR